MPKTQHELPITDAGHKFLELYAEPVVTNTYLKVAILVLSVVTLASLALLYRADTAASRLKPLIISITDAGRGQVVNYADFSHVPVERVSKYYLARWAQLYYGRNHATLQRDFADSLSFFSNDLQSAPASHPAIRWKRNSVTPQNHAATWRDCVRSRAAPSAPDSIC